MPSGPRRRKGRRPPFANVFLHYVLDLWVHQWRRRHGHGHVIIGRYADDFVMAFNTRRTRETLTDLRDRLARFSLTLHDDKTLLIEFGNRPNGDNSAVRLGRRPLPSSISRTTVRGAEMAVSSGSDGPQTVDPQAARRA